MKLLSYILSPIFLLIFFLILVIFQPLQWLSFNLFGQKGHTKIVEALNFFSVKSILLIGVSVQLINKYKMPENTSIIFVANHQSTFDIPTIGWLFRKKHPKFVAKIELGKRIPSVSYNLKKGGGALINRKDPKQAITELVKFSKRINENKWAAVIFPEGTRGRNGVPKKFETSGLKVITKYNKDGYVVPLSINNSWKIFKYGKFPLGMGNLVTVIAHEPIKVSSLPFEELLEKTERVIKEHIK